MSVLLRGLSLALALTLALVVPALAGAQDTPEALARRAAQAWSRHDAGGLAALLAPSGITLRLGDQAHTGVNARQARAALEAFLGRHEPGEARVRRAEALGGEPPRGMVELTWTTAPQGTREPVGYVIFLGLARAEAGWRVLEIRILR